MHISQTASQLNCSMCHSQHHSEDRTNDMYVLMELESLFVSSINLGSWVTDVEACACSGCKTPALKTVPTAMASPLLLDAALATFRLHLFLQVLKDCVDCNHKRHCVALRRGAVSTRRFVSSDQGRVQGRSTTDSSNLTCLGM